MKEQVGVDVLRDELRILEELRTNDATSQTIFRQYLQSTNIVVSRREYEQLKTDVDRFKRLDRHLRIKISEFIAKSRDYPMTATNNRYDEIVKRLQEILE